MMMVRKMLGGAVLIAMVCLVGLGLQKVGFHSQPKEKVVSMEQKLQPATNFVLPGMDGQKSDLIKKGKPTIIHFWTSWCGSCKVEFPMLQKMYEQYQNDVQFQLVNLAVEDDPAEVKRLMRSKNYHFPVLFDFSGEVGEAYQVVSIPTTYFVDRDGFIQKKVVGVMTERQFQEMIAMVKRSRKG